MSEPENGKLYILEQLGAARRTVEDCMCSMPELRKKVAELLEKKKQAKAMESYQLLRSQKTNLTGALETLRLCLLELEQPNTSAYARKLKTSISAFDLQTPDYSKMTAVVKGFLDKVPDGTEGTTNARIIGRLMANVRMGYYPTDPVHVTWIAKGLRWPEESAVNLLDPCCGEGHALHTLGIGHSCVKYGAELDSCRAEEAQSRLDRVAMGDYFHARISHEQFHVLFLNPPYLSVLAEGGKKARHEKTFLFESADKLVMGEFWSTSFPTTG